MATTHNSSINPLEAQTPPRQLVVTLTLTPEEAALLDQQLARIHDGARKLGAQLGLEVVELTPEEYAAQLLLTALYNA